MNRKARTLLEGLRAFGFPGAISFPAWFEET